MNNLGNSFIHYDYQKQAIKWQNGGENYDKKYVLSFISLHSRL